MEKACSKCGKTKPFDEFYRQTNGKNGRRSRCKACFGAEVTSYRSGPGQSGVLRRAKVYYRNRTPEQVRRYELARYGITPEEFDALFAGQGFACASCNSDDPAGNGWAVDHDHACCNGRGSCGKCVRGILCNRCNVMLGMARDMPNVLRAGADYLERQNVTL